MVAIVQSNYIPWKGYFDLIALADEFVLYDTVQYTRNDWRNRNLIKTPQGKQWLTIPVKVKGRYFQSIEDTEISDSQWRKNHIKTLHANFAKSRHFDEIFPMVLKWYNECESANLSMINQHFIQWICNYLGISTRVIHGSEFSVSGSPSEKLLQIVKELGGTIYLSGPAAKGYLDTENFAKNNIQVNWMDYSNYPEYKQLFGPFEHGVSILDLIFNEGKEAPNFMQFSRLNS